MYQEIQLQVKTDLAASYQILSWFEQLNQPPLTDAKTWWQCQTLIYEGFTNIVEHAHQDLPPETPIVLAAVRSDRAIEISIWGYGKPFDLEQKLSEMAEFEGNDRERGRGLKIISQLADGFSYQLTLDTRHCLWMKKYY